MALQLPMAVGFDSASCLSGCLAMSTPSFTSAAFISLPFFFSNITSSGCHRSCVNTDASSPSSSSLSFSTSSVSRRRCYSLRGGRCNEEHELVRQWTEADQPFPSDERFTVVSYNILGDRNARKHGYLYENVPPSYLKWDQRKKVICSELIELNPDIICLQEVDNYFDLSDIFVKAGYVGSYKRRTGDSVDGCAIFWKSDKFRLLDEEGIEFKRFNLRDNVAQLCLFEMSKGGSRKLLIGNIHVLYYPRKGDVKLGQIRVLLSRAHILSEKWSKVPFLLAGDFNSTPQSAIYKYLSSSELNIMLYDRREMSGQTHSHPSKVVGVKETSAPYILDGRWTNEEVKLATGDVDCYLAVHPFNLMSSYATIRGSARTRLSNGEPLATSYHSKFLGTVDYLWYSDDLVATRVLDTLPIDVLERIGGLPCHKLGSDHLALVSEFAFKQ